LKDVGVAECSCPSWHGPIASADRGFLRDFFVMANSGRHASPPHRVIQRSIWPVNKHHPGLFVPPSATAKQVRPPPQVRSGVRNEFGSDASTAVARQIVPRLPACFLYGFMEVVQKPPILRIMARPTAAPANPPPPPPAESAYDGTPVTSARSLRQLSIYLLGSACLLASTAITRKAVWRRQLRTKPKFYEANTNPHEYFSPFSDACQALNLATMHCASVGIMALGGAMWTFDIANLKEARAALRRRLNYDRIYQSEDEVPNSISEMIAASGQMQIREDDEAEGSDKTQ
jgi:hypothetical protein